MYNDYYLQQIDNKLGTTNSRLNDIISNQNEIIINQEILISGDKDIIQNQVEIKNGIGMCVLLTLTILIYLFVVRSMK